MKGVPRVFKSETLCLRSVWLCAVLGFLSLSLIQSYQLVNEYLQFNTVTQTIEISMRPYQKEIEEILPEINVCNLNPLSSNRSRYAGLPTLSSYYQLVRNVTACHKCDDTTRMRLESIRADLLSPWGYYQYIGRQNAPRVGHQVDDMVVACHILVLDGVQRRKVNCGNTLRVSPYTTSFFFNCFNIKVPLGNVSWILGMSFILYLDNFHEDDDDEFNLFNEFGQRTGVIFGVQDRLVIPSQELSGMEISPGVATTIRILPKKRHRLPAPYGTCRPLTDDSYIHVPVYDVYIKPTPEVCVSQCLEKAIREQCQCLDLHLFILPAWNRTAIPYCADVKQGASRLYFRMRCAQNIRETMQATCLSSCPFLCQENTYTVNMAQTKWPDKSKLRSFYTNILRTKPYRERFKVFENIARDRNGSLRDSPQFRLASELVGENFLQMSISLEDFKYVAMLDTPKLSLITLISQLGGTLNLWSGITAIFLVEVGELLFRILVKREVVTQSKISNTEQRY